MSSHPPQGEWLSLFIEEVSTLAWFLLHYFNVSHWCKVKVAQSCLTLCDPMTIQSMEFSRPEYWSGIVLPSPGDLSNPGIEPRSHTLQADSLPAEPPGKPKLLKGFAFQVRMFGAQEDLHH